MRPPWPGGYLLMRCKQTETSYEFPAQKGAIQGDESQQEGEKFTVYNLKCLFSSST